jgi:eukaryotic-like serine/threonine-protein kinase
LALLSGTRLGPYEILSAIGAGGMGEVYRARDPRLDRDVAIKVLPEAFAADAARVARFQREARLLASLDHPNIAHIFGLEQNGHVHALAMEFVAGDDLSQRIARGPIPLDEALPIASQIAEALEAAHQQGIIHRDLKPANIKLKARGAPDASDCTVKLLDFGLAKALEPSPDLAGDVTSSPTISGPAMTEMGMILGTAAYMSPEQARGKPLDNRTDIWSFGCVLFEMLTGRRPFAGNDVSDVLASVLAREPDLSALPDTVPPSIRRLLRRCLHKDPQQRLRDIGDARIEIRDARARVNPEARLVPGSAPIRRNRERAVWIAALTLLALALADSWRMSLRPPVAVSEMRVEISTPPTTMPLSLAISPDGKTVAFVATTDGQSRLWLRSLETGLARVLAGTEAPEAPFWSPDGRSIGFFADNKLRRVGVDGGSVQTLANAGFGSGGTWNQDNVILFAALGRPISRVPASGGEPVALARLAQKGSDFAPQFLPDGRHFLYYVRGNPESRGVYIGQLDGSAEPRRLLVSDTGAVFAPSGHLLFVRDGALIAQAFDPTRLELSSGSGVQVAERVASDMSSPGVSVSRVGTIAYRTRSSGARRQFAWFTRTGKEIRRVGDSVNTALSNPSLSPDGQHVVLYRGMDGNTDVWLLETKRGTLSRFTDDAADDVMPVWSPHGDRIIFSSNRTGVPSLYSKSVAGDGNGEPLLSTAQPQTPTDWSRDGRYVLVNNHDPKLGINVWAVALDGKAKPFPVVQTAYDEQSGQFSPDGHWIAYQSNESGSHEIYLRPFPGPGNRVPVSTNGGTHLRWRPDGKELFYVAPDGRLMAVPIGLAPGTNSPEIGTAEPLFTPPLGGAVRQADFRHQYMVSPDGQQFLVAVAMDGPTSPISLIVNWKREQ